MRDAHDDDANTTTPHARPIGLQAFESLAIRRRLTPMIRESIRALLAERGQLWNVRGEQGGNLCTEEAFDTILGQFLERVPEAAAVLADNRAIERARARQQASIDAVRRAGAGAP